MSNSANINALTNLVNNIQDALGTAETGSALVEVARNAHRAEQELASLKRKLEEEFEGDGAPEPTVEFGCWFQTTGLITLEGIVDQEDSVVVAPLWALASFKIY